MSPAQSLWSDVPLFLHPQHIPSVLCPSNGAEQAHDPRTDGQSGRLAVQSPLTAAAAEVLLLVRGQNTDDEARQCDPTHNVLDTKMAIDAARPKHIAKCMEDHDVHGWIIAALLREMGGLEGQAKLESVEGTFSFAKCVRQGGIECPSRLWLKIAMQILGNVEP